MTETDLVIIGGGVGGYIAALKGAQLGLKIILVEKDQIGGLCLNRGCIPTKALVNSARVWNYIKNANQYGISAENIAFDFAKIMSRKDRIVQRLSKGVQSLLKARKVQVIKGKADILSPGQVAVYSAEGKNQKILKTKHIIIATGSADKKIDIEGMNQENVIDTDQALSLEKLPEKMLIIGGGYSGIEFGCIFNSFGVKVRIVDILDRILWSADEEIARSLLDQLEKKGIQFSLDSQIEKIVSGKNKLSVFLKTGKDENNKGEIETEKMLISAGRVPDFGGLNIDGLGIELENGGIKVDHYMRTNIPGIYAVGDVVAKKMLAHVASMQGQIAVEHMAGFKRPMSYQAVPFGVFCNPQVAGVGLNEDEARKAFSGIKIFKFPYQANGKALSMNKQEGYVKMIADKKDNKIVGIHIIGAYATDLIAEATLALQQGCTASDIAQTIHAHPTLSEMIAEASEGILGYPIHVLR